MLIEITTHYIDLLDRRYKFNVGGSVVIAFRWHNDWEIIGIWRTKTTITTASI